MTNLIKLVTNKMLSTAVGAVAFVVDLFLQGVPTNVVVSSTGRYRNSLPATGSALSNPTAPTEWTIFVSFRGCLELCSIYSLFSDRRTVHFTGDPLSIITLPAYTELPLRFSHCSAAIHCNSQLETNTRRHNMTAPQ